jgi:3-hydroxybutyryl-CoA dehydrogenase
LAINIKNVAVLGLGNLGAQIAAQSVACGYQVWGYDPDPAIFSKTLDAYLAIDQSKVRPTPIKVAEWPEHAKKVKICSDLAEAVAQADLVIEVVPENLDIKLQVWAEMDQAAPPHAILATNSSSMPVSKVEGATKRPDKCLNMHFYRPELGQNMADVMGGSQTSAEVLDAGRGFVASLDVIPLKVLKESLGFCFNRVWRAIKRETLHMWAQGIVDFRDVDRAYMIFNNTSWGPFGLMDAVGLDVVYDIEMVYYNESQDPKDHPPQALKDKVEAGELGAKTGQGFYSYPNPEYQDSDFLNP